LTGRKLNRSEGLDIEGWPCEDLDFILQKALKELVIKLKL
jgi:hypothetical protein